MDSSCSTAATCLHLRPLPVAWYLHAHMGSLGGMGTRRLWLFALCGATSHWSPPKALIRLSFWHMRSPLRVIACCDGLPLRPFSGAMSDMIYYTI